MKLIEENKTYTRYILAGTSLPKCIKISYNNFTSSHGDTLLQYLNSMQPIPKGRVIGHKGKVPDVLSAVLIFSPLTAVFLSFSDFTLRYTLHKSCISKVSDLLVINNTPVICFSEKVINLQSNNMKYIT